MIGSRENRSLRRLAGRAYVLLAATVVISVLLGLLWQTGYRTEQLVSDIRSYYWSVPLPSRNDVAIVAISDRTLDQFSYNEPIDRRFLASLLQTIASDGAKEIGLDILFDRATEPQKDAQLAATIRQLRIPVVAASLACLPGQTASAESYANVFVTKAMRGCVSMSGNIGDGVLRWFDPRPIDQDGQASYSFAGLLAARLGARVPSGGMAIAWRARNEPFAIIPAELVRAIPPQILRNKIVLVGRISKIVDHYQTVQSQLLDTEDTPGVEIEAQALVTILDNPKPAEPSARVDFLSAILGLVLGVAASLFLPGSAVRRAGLMWSSVLAYWIVASVLWALSGVALPLIFPAVLYLVGFLGTSGARRLARE